MKLEKKPLNWLKPDPKQPRKTFPEAELRLLGESLKTRQNDPVQAFPDGTLIDGERRWRAAGLAGLTHLWVIVTEAAVSDSEAAKLRLTTFFHREDLTPYEKWQACAELMCMNPAWQGKDLAEALKVDPATVTRLLSPSKLTEEWQAALKSGKVSISDCYAASKLPADKQAGLLALKLSGASRDDLEQAVKKTRVPKPTALSSRIKVPLASGVTVTVAGEEMSLEDAIAAMSDAVKLAKAALARGITARSAQSVWKTLADTGLVGAGGLRPAADDKPEAAGR